MQRPGRIRTHAGLASGTRLLHILLFAEAPRLHPPPCVLIERSSSNSAPCRHPRLRNARSVHFRRCRRVLCHVGPRCSGKGKRLGTLRSFFLFCMNLEWLLKNPVTSHLKPPLGANRAALSTCDAPEAVTTICLSLQTVECSSDQARADAPGDLIPNEESLTMKLSIVSGGEQVASRAKVECNDSVLRLRNCGACQA